MDRSRVRRGRGTIHCGWAWQLHCLQGIYIGIDDTRRIQDICMGEGQLKIHVGNKKCLAYSINCFIWDFAKKNIRGQM